jgi:hypothetical protein
MFFYLKFQIVKDYIVLTILNFVTRNLETEDVNRRHGLLLRIAPEPVASACIMGQLPKYSVSVITYKHVHIAWDS